MSKLRLKTPSGGSVAFTASEDSSLDTVVLVPTGNATMATSEQVAGNVSALAASSGASLVGYMPIGGVATTVQAKLRESVDAADYIAVPGASDALDQAGVQAAVDQATINGGRVRIRQPISAAWDLSLIAIPTDVLIDDERYSYAGHTSVYATGTDVEYRIHGTSLTSGEGPSFVAVNNATTGDRTVSIVGRYGAGAGASVNCYMHLGVWDGANWFREFDMITDGSSGFRSNWRVGYGTAQLNAGITGAAAHTANQVLIVNRPAGMGAGGMAFEVDNTVSKFNTEVKIQVANAPLRFCAADGTPNWTFLDQYPSAGQFTLYDHNTSSNKLVFTSAGATTLAGTFVPTNIKTPPVTVANLPVAATIGAGGRSFVSDATATTFASIVAGGGANPVPVYSDGTNWRIG